MFKGTSTLKLPRCGEFPSEIPNHNPSGNNSLDWKGAQTFPVSIAAKKMGGCETRPDHGSGAQLWVTRTTVRDELVSSQQISNSGEKGMNAVKKKFMSHAAIAFLLCLVPSIASAQHYTRIDLVSSIPGDGTNAVNPLDNQLLNSWGLTRS